MTTIPTAAVLVLLAACSGGGSSAPTSTTAYQRPGWMAAQAQADEQLVEDQSSCLSAAGYTFEVDGAGMFQASEGTDSSAFSAMLYQCTEDAMGADFMWTPSPAELRSLYERQLEVAACLKNEGITVTEPPTVDAYVDSGGNWTPYEAVTASGAEQVRLRQTCPEPGPRSL